MLVREKPKKVLAEGSRFGGIPVVSEAVISENPDQSSEVLEIMNVTLLPERLTTSQVRVRICMYLAP